MVIAEVWLDTLFVMFWGLVADEVLSTVFRRCVVGVKLVVSDDVDFGATEAAWVKFFADSVVSVVASVDLFAAVARPDVKAGVCVEV